MRCVCVLVIQRDDNERRQRGTRMRFEMMMKRSLVREKRDSKFSWDRFGVMRAACVGCVTRRGVKSVCLCFMRGFRATARRGWGGDGAHLVGGNERA